MRRVLPIIVALLVTSGLFTVSPAADIAVDGSGGGDFTSIQSAINSADTGDVITVYPGTYYENVRFYGKNLVLQSSAPTDPTIVASTIIDANNYGHVIQFDGSEDESCLLSGFTIRGGGEMNFGGGIRGGDEFGDHCRATVSYCLITENYAYDRGAGIFQLDGDIINCTISNNTAGYYYGGGLYECHGTIEGCTITGNYAKEEGGGLLNCTGNIIGCTISGNSSDYVGGGLYACTGGIINCTISANSSAEGAGLFACDGTISRCVISENQASDCGGGFYSCDADISNCLIIDNYAQNEGGGMVDCIGPLVNCTLAGNQSSTGGALYRSTGYISDSILWGNSAGQGAQLYDCSTPTYCCIQDWPEIGTVSGNIASNPHFCTGDLGDYYLSHIAAGQLADSPCIDAGSDTAAALGLSYFSTRTDGVVDEGMADIGCHFSVAGAGPPELPYSTAYAPAATNYTPIPVEFQAGDYGPGLNVVTLWYSKDGGAWTETAYTSSSYQGTFYFEVTEGEGTYSFYTIAEDNDGYVEEAPDLADCSTIYDLQPPESSCTSAEYDEYSPIEVEFTASDSLSGIHVVTLWYRHESGGWYFSGLIEYSSSGIFQFTPTDGNGTYQFATVAYDNADNGEIPVGPDTETLFEGSIGAWAKVVLYETVYHAGSSMDCYLQLANEGPDVEVDIYVCFILPDGAILSYTGESLDYGFFPWLTYYYMENGFDWGPGLIFSAWISEDAPRGHYVYGAAVSTPGGYHTISPESYIWFTVMD